MSLKLLAPPLSPLLKQWNWWSSSISAKLQPNTSGALTKRGVRGHTNKGLVRTSAFFSFFFFFFWLVVQSQCDLGHIYPLKVKQRKDVKKKAMWNVQCIEVCWAGFMMNPPASPVRWFLLMAGDFSPEFLFSSAWSCQSWSPPRDLACQTCLQ